MDEMCRVLDVSESVYRTWKRGGKPVRRRLTDAQMLALIHAIDAEYKGGPWQPAYGQGAANGAELSVTPEGNGHAAGDDIPQSGAQPRSGDDSNAGMGGARAVHPK